MCIGTRQRSEGTTRIQAGREFADRSAAGGKVLITDGPVKVVSRLLIRVQHIYATALQRRFAERDEMRTKRREHQREHDHRRKRTNAVWHQPWFEEPRYPATERRWRSLT